MTATVNPRAARDTTPLAAGQPRPDGAPGHGPGPAPSSTSPDTARAALPVVRRKHVGRWVTAALLTFLAAQFLFSLATNPRYEWGVFAEYFFAPVVLSGLGLALLLTVLGTILGFALGTVLAVLRLSPSPLLSAPAWAFVWFFRSVPLVVLILVFYNLGYLYPTLGLGTPFTTDYWLVEFQTTLTITAFAAALIGISLHEAAYASEIIRGGILSVDAGQLEASAALGLPATVRFFRIVLPQAARAILPNAFNLVIGLIKGTSVVFVVALPEIFYTVQVIYNRNGRVIPLLLVACVWYALITTLLSIAQYYVERRFAHGTSRVLPPTPLQRVRGALARWWRSLASEGTTAPPPGSAGSAAAAALATETQGVTR
ncbi:amino acid ABC transporter permease [Galactobacter valiniphilus]|uniref:Amino acid ABC transporter permease n=1 Tax=Galactobacter valiniphilus TaxID=2676122 RepID=A0A399JBZ2_9MICC|nr:amino acid ABC transporter permease [Galactobacter valiniphilus]RII43058.1 amino acid ABC transporter permease [Galactobacter valiniphilus]